MSYIESVGLHFARDAQIDRSALWAFKSVVEAFVHRHLPIVQTNLRLIFLATIVCPPVDNCGGRGEQTSSRRVPNHNGVGRPVVSWQSNSMATAQWLRRGMGNYEFQEAMRSGHFPIATDEAFRILLARLERAEFDQIRS